MTDRQIYAILFTILLLPIATCIVVAFFHPDPWNSYMAGFLFGLTPFTTLIALAGLNDTKLGMKVMKFFG